jgi:hypothetical protein
LRADTEEGTLAAQEELAVADGGGGEAFLAEVVLRDADELRPGLHHIHHPLVVEEIDGPLGRDEGGVLRAEAFGPKEVAGLGRKAVRLTRVVNDQKTVALDDGGRDVGDAAGGAPGDVGLGDVAAAVSARQPACGAVLSEASAQLHGLLR